MSYRDKIRQTRGVVTETDTGGSIEGDPATVLETVADVKILRDIRQLEALSIQYGKAIIIRIRDRKGLDVRPNDTFHWNGKKYTAQGGWVPTESRKEVTLLAQEQ